jgi:hypothetical protein
MPYIKDKNRKEFEFCIDQLTDRIEKPGELNYVITKLCDRFVMTRKECYGSYNMVLGVLTAVTQELYRRKVASYEDKKLYENGDVYDFKTKEVCKMNEQGKLCTDPNCPIHGAANKIVQSKEDSDE